MVVVIGWPKTSKPLAMKILPAPPTPPATPVTDRQRVTASGGLKKFPRPPLRYGCTLFGIDPSGCTAPSGPAMLPIGALVTAAAAIPLSEPPAIVMTLVAILIAETYATIGAVLPALPAPPTATHWPGENSVASLTVIFAEAAVVVPVVK